ncbi:probable leucine-rich repeat-containing protein 1 at C-terminar half [Coccomyxa sp. Obi]|nr:probable leucine-rich repeat-containing protein 1 at C-terminar half [Coccomyxa sp. Obi]
MASTGRHRLTEAWAETAPSTSKLAGLAGQPQPRDQQTFGGTDGLLQPLRHNIRLRKNIDQDCGGRARGSRKRQALPPRLKRDDDIFSTSIAALPSDLLVHIFSHLDVKAHRFVLPLVCRQWNDLLARPLGLWNHVDVDFAEEVQTGTSASVPLLQAGSPVTQPSGGFAIVRQDSITRWLHRRAAAVRSLRLRGSGDLEGALVPVTDRPQPQEYLEPPRIHDFNRFGLATILTTVVVSLEELVIERCYDLITTAAFRAMGGCKKLKVLSLKGIRSVLDVEDFEAIAALRQLEELVLDCDQPPEPEPGTEEIKWGLPEFPEGMLHLVNMTHLTLSCHYGITELPAGITSLNKLEVLNLDFCTLSALPAVLGELTALTTLDVEGNLYLGDSFRGATTPTGAATPAFAAPPFPLDLEGLQSLRYLNLNSCGLTAIPSVLSTLRNLETLDLEDNDLAVSLPEWHLSSSLGYLSRLQCLNLAQCRLESVPAQVEKLSSLRILDLTNNRIGNEGLPMSLARLPHLRAIGLKKNALTTVPRVLGYMRSLQEIYLEDNADLQVNAPLDFLLDLPNLRSVMIGKQSGSWSPCSMLYMTDFMMKLMAQHPTKNILRISCPGHNATPFDEEDAAT